MFRRLRKVTAIVSFFILILGLSPLFIAVAAASHDVASYSDFVTALAVAADGDTINVTKDITVTAALTIDKAITVNGGGFTVTVPVPGLDSSGIYNAAPSNFRVFDTNVSGKTIVISDMSIKGGRVAASGAGILNYDGTTLKLNGVSISNSRGSDSYGGGGLVNPTGGVVFLNNCNISRNAARFGGGFLNGGTMFVESSTFSENRSTGFDGGGGAGENQSLLYINNSTFANNKSTELGGAINNVLGTTYATNSTFTGNVAYGTFAGGAIANNGGTATVMNSIFAYNYKNTGTPSAPVYALSDIFKYDGNAATAYYSIFQTSDVTSVVSDPSNISYTGLADGSDNSIFTGGINAKILGPTGVELGANTVFQPFLVKASADSTPTVPLKASSPALATGTQTGFTNGDGTPIVGYYNGSTWVDKVGAGSSGHEVTVDQNGVTRAATPAVGSVEATVSGIDMLKVVAPTDGGGSVSGGTVYGDTYVSGSVITLTAIADDGYKFDSWSDISDGSGTTVSISNPYTVTLTDNLIIAPIFNVMASGYMVTYAGNGNTGGVPHASVEYAAGTNATINNNNTLTKSGYNFNGWNTRENGSGTNYYYGDTYSEQNNLTLYAQWSVGVGDNTPPTFSQLPGTSGVINVNENQVITTNPYILKVLPTDSNGISRVEFYIDDIIIGTDTTADSDGVYSCAWDTSKYHSTVTVYAYDNSALRNRSLVLRRTATVNLGIVTTSSITGLTELPATGKSR